MKISKFAYDFIYHTELFKHTKNINVMQVNLEIKPSTIEGAGDGVFTKDYIPKGTYFLELSIADQDTNIYFTKMNDLAFNGNIEEYTTDIAIFGNINVGYVIAVQDIYQMFFGGFVKMYCRANKNIKAGEELSKYYGTEFWYSHIMNKLCPNCKFLKTHFDEDLPHLYIYYDEIRPFLSSNRKMTLFACKQNDKYYYAVGYGKEYYKNPSTHKINDNIIDVTKSDFSPYSVNEIIFEDYFRLKYLKQQNELQPDSNNTQLTITNGSTTNNSIANNTTTSDIQNDKTSDTPKGKPLDLKIYINKVKSSAYNNSDKVSLFGRLKKKISAFI
jgi:hypothetical protein